MKGMGRHRDREEKMNAYKREADENPRTMPKNVLLPTFAASRFLPSFRLVLFQMGR